MTSQADEHRFPPQLDGGRAAGAAARAMTGWDLIAAAQARIAQFWTLTQSQVYWELSSMEGRAIRGGAPG